MIHLYTDFIWYLDPQYFVAHLLCLARCSCSRHIQIDLTLVTHSFAHSLLNPAASLLCPPSWPIERFILLILLFICNQLQNNLVFSRSWSNNSCANWFYLYEYFKFSIHIFTTVKCQTILKMITIFKLDSVLKVLASIWSWQNLKF